jgi:hypothetical protein
MSRHSVENVQASKIMLYCTTMEDMSLHSCQKAQNANCQEQTAANSTMIYIVRTFVNVTMYPQYNSNFLKSELQG